MPTPKHVWGINKYLPATNPSGVTNAPLAVWQLDGDSSLWLTDRTVNGRDLSIVTGTFEFLPDPVMGLVGAFFGSGDHELIAPDLDIFRIAKDTGGGGDASLTIEMIVRSTTSAGLWFECAAGGESDETNYLYHLGRTWSDSGTLKYYSFNEYGTGGTNISVNFTEKERLNELIYGALTISADGTVRKLYLNGVLVSTITTTAAQKAPTGNVQRLRFGRQDGNDYDFKGWMFGGRITDEIFGDADVLEAYNDLVGDKIEVPSSILKASFLDENVFLPAGGEPNQSDPLPGSTRGQLVSSPGVGFYDENEFQGSLGRPSHGPIAEDHGALKFVGGTSFNEAIEIEQGSIPEFNNATVDGEGNYHFASTMPAPYRAFFYNTTGERWANPTAGNFTGYARNGKHYTNGVEDAGPVWAPWASEAFGANRGLRNDFPVKSLIVIAQQELCIFDLDTFDGSVASLRLWMRFRHGTSSSFWMIGRGDWTLRDVKMRNGLLVPAQRNTSWEDGRVILIDFKGDTTYNTGNMIGATNHWRWDGTIVQRNEAHFITSGVSPSLRQNNERIYSVDILSDDDGTAWVAYAGEDDNGVVRVPVGGRPDWVISVTGPDTGESDLDDYGYRNVFFDRLGILWFSIGTRLFRNVKSFRQGVIVADLKSGRKVTSVYKSVDLKADIRDIAEAQNFIFVVAEGVGIYAVNRHTLRGHLAYTVANGGGSGARDIPGNGEIFKGQGNPVVKSISSFSLEHANFLAMRTHLPVDGKPEASIIRTTDDHIPAWFQFPALADPLPLFHVIIF